MKELEEYLYGLDDFPEKYIHIIEEWYDNRPKPIRNVVPPPKRKLTPAELMDCKNGKLFQETVITNDGEVHEFIFNPATKKWVKEESPTAGLIKFFSEL